MKSGRTFFKKSILYSIPFFAMTALMMTIMNHFFNVLQTQNHDIMRTQLERSLNKIEEDLFESSQLAVEISLDTTLSNAEMQNYKKTTVKGINRLLEYKLRMDWCKSLFVSYAPDRIISDSGSCSLNTFSERTLSLTDESKEVFKNAINGRKNIGSVLQTEGGTRYLLLLYYYPELTYIGERWVGFIISENEMVEKLQSVLGNMDSLLILKYGDEMLAEVNKLSFSDEKNADIQDDLVNGNDTISGYTVMTFKGKTLDLSIDVALNTSILEAALLKEQIKLFGITFSVFLTLSVFLWVYSKYQYKKAQEIQLLAVNMYPEINNINGEYEFIRKVLERDIERLHTQDQMLDYFRKESKNQLTWLLLKSMPPEELQIDELMENCGVCDNGSYYVVLEFLLSANEGDFDFLDEDERILMRCLDKHEEGTLLILVFSLQTRDSEHQERIHFAEEVLHELIIKGHVCKGITCGLVYENINEIYSSQEEAFSLVALLNNVNENGQTKILFFDETTKMPKKVSHAVADDLQHFKECLIEQRYEESKKVLEELLCNNDNTEMLSYVRYKIVQMILDVLKLKDNSTEVISNLMRIVDLEKNDYKEEIEKYIVLLSDNNEANSIEAEQILCYIAEHALDSDISLCGVADQFNISVRTVNRIMKERMNTTYKGYISRLRLNRACELLKEDNQDIQSVALHVGYYNVTSFNRLFKETYGMSPREYRAKEKNKG